MSSSLNSKLTEKPTSSKQMGRSGENNTTTKKEKENSTSICLLLPIITGIENEDWQYQLSLDLFGVYEKQK